MTQQAICNAAFLTCIYAEDGDNGQRMEEMLSALPEDGGAPWEEIGYKYIAPLGGLSRRNELLAREPWLKAVADAVADPKNRVKDAVERGVSLWEKELSRRNLVFNENALANGLSEYLNRRTSARDLALLQSLRLPDRSGAYFPINRRGKWSVGIVNPWPGDMSAEAEVLSRMKAGADDAGIDLVMLSNFGHVLDPETQMQTERFASPDELDFVISTHYDTPKSLDSFYYHTLWNPPEIPLNLDDYSGHVTDDYLMNDDFLIYDSGGMSGHLECILQNSRRNLEGASSLTASFPAKSVLPPRLDDPKMFYCGMNWERVVHHTNRHEGLFRLLDGTGKVKFFGPEKVEAWGGIRPWDGYQCYQYSIPFDGFSILKEINDCGIYLVLSSDIHRRAGSATNRTYEACAAGAVIISDDNPFMQKNFRDAALFIQYNKNDPEDTFRQLMEKYEWIVGHKEEALRMAERAQRIFLERFAVDLQLRNIISAHYSRQERVREMLFARHERGVLVTFVVNTRDIEDAKKLLAPVLDNVERQYYRNIRLAVAADRAVAEELSAFCRGKSRSVLVRAMELFDGKGSRRMTDAEAEAELHGLWEHAYFVNSRGEEIWFRDHITTMVRTLEDSGAKFAYSGRLFEDSLGYRRPDMFRKLTLSTIYDMNCPDWMPVPGQILFAADCHSVLSACMHPFLDGAEHYALMNLLTLREKCPGVFTRRMSFNYRDGKWDERNAVMPLPMQIRLIRDAVKYDLPERGLTVTVPGSVSGAVSSREVMRLALLMPVKKWFSLRVMRVLLRILPSHGRLYKKVAERYQVKSEALLNFFN